MKYFAASSSDLGQSATNPAGIWSPSFLAFKQALDRGDDAANVLQALSDWLSTRGIEPTKLDRILKLPDINQAYQALVGLIGAGFKADRLPEAVQKTLQQAIQRLAVNYVASREQAITKERDELSAINSRFSGESASKIVTKLLGD
jgi:hypothetical protein